MKTLKIMPSHESQGDFVIINEEDFDAEKHELYGTPDTNGDGELSKDELYAALDEKGIAYKKTMGVAKLKALLEG